MNIELSNSITTQRCELWIVQYYVATTPFSSPSLFSAPPCANLSPTTQPPLFPSPSTPPSPSFTFHLTDILLSFSTLAFVYPSVDQLHLNDIPPVSLPGCVHPPAFTPIPNTIVWRRILIQNITYPYPPDTTYWVTPTLCFLKPASAVPGLSTPSFLRLEQFPGATEIWWTFHEKEWSNNHLLSLHVVDSMNDVAPLHWAWCIILHSNRGRGLN